METTIIQNLKINVLTQEQYNALEEKDENQIYYSEALPAFSLVNNGQVLRIINGTPTWITN